MKQALVEGSVPIPGIPMYEQGQGKLNLINSMNILKSYQPKASIVPKKLDFTDCPFMWPFCTQPIYANALPLIFNATVLNAMALTGVLCCCPGFLLSCFLQSWVVFQLYKKFRVLGVGTWYLSVVLFHHAI